MAAQTKGVGRRFEVMQYKQYTLATPKVAWKGAIAVIDQSVGKCIPGEVQADLFMLGTFAEDKSAAAADVLVNVELKREVKGKWFANDGTNPVTATDIGKPVYIVDDQTVSILSTGRSIIGLAWAIDTVKGVFVEMGVVN